eukprot:TRINITY_DN3828_c1_g1_i1.p1 TRINITY_DN3828_c1_g1~~TRINITY_DN3828_c1_g1_i1.p1  ORF type:complete len:284 (-),score=109.09 TRINITY_DN3828_c1_g1_i1:103-888(-)
MAAEGKPPPPPDEAPATGGGLKFSWGKKVMGKVTQRPRPLIQPGTSMSIVKETAAAEAEKFKGEVGERPAASLTDEEKEKRRKRMEAWRKVQEAEEQKALDEAAAKKFKRADDGESDKDLSPEEKMAKVKEALKEVNQRNKDLAGFGSGGVKAKKDKKEKKEKKKRKRSSSSSSGEIEIVATGETDLIITRADNRLTAAAARAEALGSGTVNLDSDDDGDAGPPGGENTASATAEAAKKTSDDGSSKPKAGEEDENGSTFL